MAGVTGIEGSSKPRSRAALWLDYDGDGLLDLFVMGDAFLLGENSPNKSWAIPRLYQQGPVGVFTDVSAQTDLATQTMFEDNPPPTGANTILRHLGGLSAGDLNGDGYPEIFVGLWQGASENVESVLGCRLFINVPGDTPGTRKFVERAAESFQLSESTPELTHRYGSHWQPIMHDFNEDGLLDIFATIDGDDNHVWINTGNVNDPVDPKLSTPMPMFVDQAVESDMEVLPGALGGASDMGVAIADYNRDGMMDVYVTNIHIVIGQSRLHNALFETTQTSPFMVEEVAFSTGTWDTQNNKLGIGGWGWGCSFGDYNNDGWVDITATNATMGPGCGASDKSVLFLSNGTEPGTCETDAPVTFCEVGAEVGFADSHLGSGLISADFDRDGDLDAVQIAMLQNVDGECDSQSLIRYLVNDTTELNNNWLVVRPRMESGNRFALGAIVRVQESGIDGWLQSRVITAGTSTSGQEPAEAHFGLGQINPKSELTISVNWMNNRLPATLSGSAGSLMDQIIDISPCAEIDIAAPFGTLDVMDIMQYLTHYLAGDMGADLNGDGALDFFDISQLVQNTMAGCP
ncbi:MAG: VCBS repeat-containing protein [Phycisphaerales bacterium]|nr:VCBS repeat-containing protein [Phycisphaerales bacterium]